MFILSSPLLYPMSSWSRCCYRLTYFWKRRSQKVVPRRSVTSTTKKQQPVWMRLTSMDGDYVLMQEDGIR